MKVSTATTSTAGLPTAKPKLAKKCSNSRLNLRLAAKPTSEASVTKTQTCKPSRYSCRNN